MIKNKTIGISIWLILFVVSIFLLFFIPNQYSNSIYVTLVFDCIAFISQLILWMNILKPNTKAKEIFVSTPSFLLSIAYVAIQFIICIVTALINNRLSFKSSLLINVILLAIMWILILTTISAKNHINDVDVRQKDHHVEL